MLISFFWLLFGHAIADYPLQGDFLSKAKNSRNPIPGVPWVQALSAHALIHAGVVGLIFAMLGAPAWLVYQAAGYEFVLHFLIDDLKNRGTFGTAERGFHIDQFCHIAIKALLAARLVAQ